MRLLCDSCMYCYGTSLVFLRFCCVDISTFLPQGLLKVMEQAWPKVCFRCERTRPSLDFANPGSRICNHCRSHNWRSRIRSSQMREPGEFDRQRGRCIPCLSNRCLRCLAIFESGELHESVDICERCPVGLAWRELHCTALRDNCWRTENVPSTGLTECSGKAQFRRLEDLEYCGTKCLAYRGVSYSTPRIS